MVYKWWNKICGKTGLCICVDFGVKLTLNTVKHETVNKIFYALFLIENERISLPRNFAVFSL